MGRDTLRMPMRLLFVAIVLHAVASSAQETPKVRSLGMAEPTSALLIGNSFFYYNNGINDHLGKLIRAAEPASKFRMTLVAISGSGADWHDVDSYFRPGALGKYSFDADNNVVFNDLKRLFDISVLMDCSQCPVHPKLRESFFAAMKKHSATVRRHGSIPVLFMSWAYQDRPEMTRGLADAYTRAGNENDALVIPAGLAFARTVERHPEIGLYVADKRHPTLAGTYLAACTMYATLFGRSPVGSSYLAGLDPTTAAAVQTLAWATVQDYLRPR